MGLIICPECSHEISDKNKMCIHCGCPMEIIKKTIKEKILLNENNEIIWDNNYAKVSYKGIVECENFWGIKMLIENKTNELLTVTAYNICMNNFVISEESNIVYNLLGHRKKFSYADMGFDELEDIGINSIDEMSDFDLKLTCKVNSEKVSESNIITLKPKKYVPSKKKDTVLITNTVRGNNKKRDFKYINKKENLILDNKIITIKYLGMEKMINGFYINLKVVNKTNDNDLILKHSDILIGNFILTTSRHISFNINRENETYHIFISDEDLKDYSELCGKAITQIEDIEDMEMFFIVYKKEKIIKKSPIIILHPVNILKELHLEMNTIIKEINNGIIWKDSLKDFSMNIKFEFVYPNGKHGDIDMYLTSCLGTVKKISSFIFSTDLSTENLYMMEILILFYYNMFSANHKFLNKTNNVEALKFLHKYNNIMQLNNYYKIASDKMERYDIQQNSTMLISYNIIKEKYQELKNKRSKIYSKIIISNKTSSKWKSEQQLYVLLKNKYKDAIYQYQSEWLGRQSLDIFIPSLNIGVEYQGIQHYEPISFFGGDEGLKKRKELDEQKRNLCLKNNIKLIEWKYDIELNNNNLEKILLEYL